MMRPTDEAIAQMEVRTDTTGPSILIIGPTASAMLLKNPVKLPCRFLNVTRIVCII